MSSAECASSERRRPPRRYNTANDAVTIRSATTLLRRALEFRTGRLRADRAFASAARSDRPILVGPFLSEIGFEVLYWLPMLARYFERHAVAKDRVVAVLHAAAPASGTRISRPAMSTSSIT